MQVKDLLSKIIVRSTVNCKITFFNQFSVVVIICFCRGCELRNNTFHRYR